MKQKSQNISHEKIINVRYFPDLTNSLVKSSVVVEEGKKNIDVIIYICSLFVTSVAGKIYQSIYQFSAMIIRYNS